VDSATTPDGRHGLLRAAFGWPAADAHRWRRLPDGQPVAIATQTLTAPGIALELDGFDYGVFHLTR